MDPNPTRGEAVKKIILLVVVIAIIAVVAKQFSSE
jgi:hypothetical protein